MTPWGLSHRSSASNSHPNDSELWATGAPGSWASTQAVLWRLTAGLTNHLLGSLEAPALLLLLIHLPLIPLFHNEPITLPREVTDLKARVVIVRNTPAFLRCMANLSPFLQGKASHAAPYPQVSSRRLVCVPTLFTVCLLYPPASS